MDDFWLVFTNEDGTPTSWHTYGGSGADICYNGSRDVDGGILMAGHTWSFGLDAPNIFFVKAAANGDSLWAIDWGDDDWEYAWDIKPTLDGGYVVLGRDYSITSGDNNIVLLKYGPHPSIYNTLEYHHTDLPIEDEQTTMDIIDIDAAPGSTVSGVTVYVDTIMHGEIRDLVISLSHGSVIDTLLLHPQAGGQNILNAIFHPAASCDAQAGIAPMSGMYSPYRTTTVFNSTSVNGPWELKIHDSQQGNTGSLKAWGIQVYYESMIGMEEWSESQAANIDLQVYPNPARNHVNCRISSPVELPADRPYTLMVYDVSGRQSGEYLLAAGKHQLSIDISAMRPGLYYMILISENIEHARTKLVVLK
jgi:subtilisin-like proprotein convertase family protein